MFVHGEYPEDIIIADSSQKADGKRFWLFLLYSDKISVQFKCPNPGVFMFVMFLQKLYFCLQGGNNLILVILIPVN